MSTQLSGSVSQTNHCPQGFIASVQILNLVDRIDTIRYDLNIPHELMQKKLGVCRNTYCAYRSSRFKKLTIEQVLLLFQLFHKVETSGVQSHNPRIQNHSRNKQHNLNVLNIEGDDPYSE